MGISEIWSFIEPQVLNPTLEGIRLPQDDACLLRNEGYAGVLPFSRYQDADFRVWLSVQLTDEGIAAFNRWCERGW